MKDLLITNIGELWTCRCDPPLRQGISDLKPSHDDAVSIVNGLIAETGPSDLLRSKYQGSLEINAGGWLVTPGLVDSHTHPIFAGDRSDEFARCCAGESYQQIAASGGGIAKTVTATRSENAKKLASRGMLNLSTMLRYGTTTAEAKTGYGLDSAAELASLKAIRLLQRSQPIDLVPTYLGGHLPPPGEDVESYVGQLCDTMIKSASESPWPPKFNDVFCEVGAFDLGQSRRILEAGLSVGLKPKIHAEEFSWMGGARLAVELGAASADHLLHITEEDIEILAASDTVATLLPGTAFYLDLPDRPPARRMISKGCILALATDFNPGSCLIGSLPFIMGLACLRLHLQPCEALAAVTVNGAAAIDLHRSHGQISAGYVGDVLLWPVRTLPELVAKFVHVCPMGIIKGGKMVSPMQIRKADGKVYSFSPSVPDLVDSE